MAKKKKFEVKIGGISPSRRKGKPSSDEKKPSPFDIEEFTDHTSPVRETISVSENTPVEPASSVEKPVVTTDISDVAKDIVDVTFYSLLFESDLSKNEQKIIKYLYEKNNSLERVVASRRELQKNLNISEGGLVYNLGNLESKGYLKRELIKVEGTKRTINAFSINLDK